MLLLLLLLLKPNGGAHWALRDRRRKFGAELPAPDIARVQS
jgi:hypothetical protein